MLISVVRPQIKMKENELLLTTQRKSALNHTFKMLLRKVLSQKSHSGVSLNFSNQQKLPHTK